MTPPFISLVPAAGSGLRFGRDERKQWAVVAGRPVLNWTVERLRRFGAQRIIVAVPHDDVDEAAALLPEAHIVEGGGTRQESVRLCLEQVAADFRGLVVVHDGVRPAVSEVDVRAVLAAASETGAAVLGRSVHDTLKEVVEGRIARTVDRSRLFRAETPQVFSREILERALADAGGFVGTDEASLVERLGDVEIRAVEATDPNPKLTRPDQLAFLESLLAEEQ